MSGRPKLLDLFCGAGGAGMGYYRAGFDVVGVDEKHQPRYPFEFVQADALEYAAKHGHEFDVIHASPPCQMHTRLAAVWRAVEGYNYDGRHSDSIPEVRSLLRATGRPYVIENVSAAVLVSPITLCGAQFGLRVYRHRFFESSNFLMAMPHSPHRDNMPAVGRGKSRKGFVSITGCGGFGFPDGHNYAKAAIGIDWMSRGELSQAIPPAYTEFIGRQLMKTVGEAAYV